MQRHYFKKEAFLCFMEEHLEATPNALQWPALREEFTHQPELTRAQVLAFYRRQDAELKHTTLDWRIHELVQRGLLASTGRGRYALADAISHRRTYRPALEPAERAIWRVLVKELQIPEGCLWSTAWANEFGLHQAARNFLVIEVPRDYAQAAFYTLQDRHHHRVFLRPQPDVLTYYVAEATRPLVVISFISRAPVQEVDKVPVPRLEKLLVDLFSRPDLFSAFQGHELKTIFSNARRRYLLDERTLLRYAQRRHKADDLRQFLRQLPDWSQPLTAA